VSNQYTSILTGGLSDNTVKTAYDLVFNKAFQESCVYRNWVTYGPEQPSMAGQTITLQKYAWFTAADVTAAKTPLNEELDVDSRKLPATTTVNLTVQEYGDAVTRTKKLTHFSIADVDGYAAMAVADHCSRTMDELIQDTLDSGTQRIGVNSHARGSIVGTDKLTATYIRQAVTKLRTNLVPDFGGYYAGGVHPHVVHDLREASGAGEWRLPHEYSAGLSSPLFTGEFGEFEGVRFVSNTRTRKSQDGSGATLANTVYRTFIQGQQAIAERVVEEPSVVLGPVTDKLQRFRTIGWYGILGWALYRDESLVRLESGSSVAAL
jgi:N4-gp56 family major capsid protein